MISHMCNPKLSPERNSGGTSAHELIGVPHRPFCVAAVLKVFYCSRARNRASGPEIIDCLRSKRPPPTAKPLEKVGDEAPHLSQWVLRYEGAI